MYVIALVSRKRLTEGWWQQVVEAAAGTGEVFSDIFRHTKVFSSMVQIIFKCFKELFTRLISCWSSIVISFPGHRI